ncbi:MAG: sulfite exporter TauE/SafE family protein [Planctomycetes bacterium]|nr:sulfite exporter TauE/SafE family protein [Planctomycetota bacterium]
MIWAWFGAAAVGLSLGLLGSGGAILTVPILVYLVGHDEKIAIAESLAIVGAISAAGVLRSAFQGRVDFRSAALLAFPGMVGTYLGAHLATWLSGAFQLLMLALLMMGAATLMFRSGNAEDVRRAREGSQERGMTPRALLTIALQGVALGMVTGLVGVGGGFLIVPVLVLLRQLPMTTAIGTSLAIITVNSSVGFAKYTTTLHLHAVPGGAVPAIDWRLVVIFSAVGILGNLLGNALAGKIPQAALKRVFALLLVAMAVFILGRQVPRVFF